MNGLVGYGRMGQRLSKIIPMRYICGRNHTLSLDEWDKVDILFDFSHASYADEIFEYARKTGCKCILGTSNYSEDILKSFKQLSSKQVILYDPNYSIGIQLIKRFIRDYKEILSTYDIEIIESHHKNKVDLPSGTALLLKACIDEYKSEIKTTPIHSIRGGNSISEHELILLGNNERITISHIAPNLDSFMSGIQAAYAFIQTRETGFYTMEDVLWDMTK